MPRRPLAAMNVDEVLAQEPLQRPFAMDSLRDSQKIALRAGDSAVEMTDDSSDFATKIGDIRDRLLDTRGATGLHGQGLLSCLAGEDSMADRPSHVADSLIVKVPAPGNSSHRGGEFSRNVPFDVSKMPELKSAVGQAMMERFKADAERSAESNASAMQRLLRSADDSVCVAA